MKLTGAREKTVFSLKSNSDVVRISEKKAIHSYLYSIYNKNHAQILVTSLAAYQSPASCMQKLGELHIKAKT